MAGKNVGTGLRSEGWRPKGMGGAFISSCIEFDIEITEVYMENLDPRVTEQDLVSTFNSIGTALVAIQIFHHSLAANGRSFCFLTLSSYDDRNIHLLLLLPPAMKALSLLDRTQVKGRHIRMMLSHRVTRLAVNLTVDGIDHSIDSEKLRNLFSAYGNIVSCRVTAKGSGYVQFDSEDSAMAAIISLHETIMQGKKLYVSNFPRRLGTYEGTNNLHVKNLDLSVNDTTLKDYFSCCGVVVSARVMRN